VPDRGQDAVDFIRVVEANQEIDLSVVEELGDLVYSGGGKDLLNLIADARAGKRLEI
jgi:hypothetical protein